MLRHGRVGRVQPGHRVGFDWSGRDDLFGLWDDSPAVRGIPAAGADPLEPGPWLPLACDRTGGRSRAYLRTGGSPNLDGTRAGGRLWADLPVQTLRCLLDEVHHPPLERVPRRCPSRKKRVNPVITTDPKWEPKNFQVRPNGYGLNQPAVSALVPKSEEWF